MKLRLLALLLVAGCTREQNTIQVDTAGSPDASAVLALCGKETSLIRSGDFLKVHRRATCEGEGEVQVRFGHGSGATSCKIGYVTSGLGQEFRFQLRDGQCQPIA